jgi:tetratricopeptide (TPR) repeat protein
MDEVVKHILDTLKGADLWIVLAFLAAGYVCWRWLGTTAIEKKKVLRRQLGMALLVAALAGAVILVYHFFYLRERGFSKDLTGVLVTRIVDDDAHNSLQGALVEKLNAELQKEETAQEIVVHASSKIVNENDGLKVAHEHARAIGQRLNAKIVIWGRKIGENKFYPRITVMDPLKDWSTARERTHDAQSITELHLPEELVDEPFYLIHFAAGFSYYAQREYEEALPHFKAALGRQGAFPNELADLQFSTAFCHYLLGANDEAIADYDKVIRLDPKYAPAYNNRGIIYQDKREYDKAINSYDEAIRLDPKYAAAYMNRGNAHQDKEDYDKAINSYDEAIRIDPKLAEAYGIRGTAYQNKREYDRAIADYDKAIRLDPKLAEAYDNFAWLLGTCPQAGFRDGKKAVEYATKACELSDWKDPPSIDTLAAAYAEVGDFEQAIKWETNFLGTSNLSGEDTAGGKSRLALYQAHQPYHAEK